MHDPHEENDFSLKSLFIPLTTFKAVHIIVIVGFVVFGNMLFNGFIGDDKVFIINNSQLHTVDIGKLFGPSLFNTSGYYRPITATYFAFLYSIFGNNFFFYHIIQLCLHIFNSIIVFLLFKKFFTKAFALSTSLIFLVHPMQVESVSYIASSGNPLFFLFGSSALLLSIKEHISLRRIVIVFILLLLSFLTRETGLLFLVLILLYRTIFIRKSFPIFLLGGFLTLVVYFFIRVDVGRVFWENICGYRLLNYHLLNG